MLCETCAEKVYASIYELFGENLHAREYEIQYEDIMQHIEKFFKIACDIPDDAPLSEKGVKEYLNQNTIYALLRNYSGYDAIFFDVNEIPKDQSLKPLKIKINYKKRGSDVEDEKTYDLREAEGIAGLLMLCQTVQFDTFRWERVPNTEIIETDGFIKRSLVIDGVIYKKYIEIDGDEHIIGDTECNNCWSDNYPKKCKCGGLIHQQFIDESYDSVCTAKRCDNCNDDYEEIDD